MGWIHFWILPWIQIQDPVGIQESDLSWIQDAGTGFRDPGFLNLA
jgi:hypothetical protein